MPKTLLFYEQCQALRCTPNNSINTLFPTFQISSDFKDLRIPATNINPRISIGV